MDPLFQSPTREYVLIPLLFLVLVIDILSPAAAPIVFAVVVVAAIPTCIEAYRSLQRKKIGIDVFNTFALIASFATLDVRSSIFIVLMLSFARLLDWITESRTTNAIESLLKLKPTTATVERNGALIDIPFEQLRVGENIVVSTGKHVPVDGIILSGEAYINESSVTGESALQKKSVGDLVISSTLNESGAFKMRATRVGSDSTIERMVALMRDAEKNKSHSEKLADKFAGIFLPLVGLLGFGTYLVTHNLNMTAALFLIACADDMAVAIPLAMTAALGRAAKQGVIIKGGEWLDALSRIDTVIFDKTGTLTYGNLQVSRITFEKGVDEPHVLQLLASAEKFSEHPVGRAVYADLATTLGSVPDPEQVLVSAGTGINATIGTDSVIIGSERIFSEQHITIPRAIQEQIKTAREEHGQTAFLVAMNGVFVATVSVSDMPRPQAAQSVTKLRELGITRISMFTGDNERIAKETAAVIGITDVHASMTPENKLRALEGIANSHHLVAMVGDGINDAPALARSNVGIAMGSAGTATAVEAANVIILSDDLSRLPAIIKLGRQTMSVIRTDTIIWMISNLFGFALVFTGIAGPALAAFYNFATDFLPLINSSRLFFDHRHRRNEL
jgi:heavy metal translocating P-type ATPase